MSDQSKLGLGQIITTEQTRDAIHCAVAPVTAGMRLQPGSHVLIDGGVAMQTNANGIGVVDPFLKIPVMEGQKFWLFLYPNTITALSHIWSHPDFPDEPKDVADEEEEYDGCSGCQD